MFCVYFDYVFSYLKKTHKNCFCKLLVRTAERTKFLDGLCVPFVFWHVLKIFCYVFGFLFVIISSSRAWAHIFTYNKAHIKVHIILLGRSWLCFNLMKCTLSSHTLYAIYRNFIFSFGQFPGKIIVLLTNNLQK